MKRVLSVLMCLLGVSLSVFANGQNEKTSTAAGKIELSMWYHGAGNDVEKVLINNVITDFNESQSEYTVVLESFPQDAYNDSVTAAALAGKLPDIIDVDGPVMPNWAWAGYMAPLDMTEADVTDFLPGAIGRYNNKIYSIGLWDSAIAMYTRKSILEKFEIRIPTLDNPWTLEEFDAILVTLQASGEFDYPFDVGMAWADEWYTYAFSPFLQSFGGDLVDRSTFMTSENVLNGPKAIEFGNWWKSLFDRDLVPGTSQDNAERDMGFLDGKYALNWNGSWSGIQAIEAFGDDLLMLPAPDFGNGPKIGAASWQFGISQSSKNKEGANAFIKFALQDKYLAAFSDGLGLIPATLTAAQITKNYKSGGAMEPFFELSKRQGVLRPETPGYNVESLIFRKALGDIANGADVQDTLDNATDEINADIEKNNGYKTK